MRARRDSELLKLDRDHSSRCSPSSRTSPSRSRLSSDATSSQPRPAAARRGAAGTVAVVALGERHRVERFCRELVTRARAAGTRGRDRAEAAQEEYAAALDRCEREQRGRAVRGARPFAAGLDRLLPAPGRPGAGAGGTHRRRGTPPAHERLRGRDLLCLVATLRARHRGSIVAVPALHRPLPAGADLRPPSSRWPAAWPVAPSGSSCRVGRARIRPHRRARGAPRGGGHDRPRRRVQHGRFVGAMFATGMPAGEMSPAAARSSSTRSPLSDYTVPSVSLVRGNRAEAMLRRTFGAGRSSGSRASSSA